MSRTIPAALLTACGRDIASLAVLVKLTRRDGTALGFSSLAANVLFGGLVYEAGGAVDAGNIESSLGAGVDNTEIIGLLDSARLSDTDLLAGVYDGATVEIFFIDYRQSPLTDRALMLSGTVGEVRFSDGTYVAQIRGLFQRLRQQVGALTSANCRAKRLGDTECKVALGSFQFTGRVLASVADGGRTLGINGLEADGFFNEGRIAFTSGPNNLWEREIKISSLVLGAQVLVLHEAFPFTPAVGNTATLERGCDRTFLTCVSVYNNAINYRGEPHMPPNEILQVRGRR